MRKKPCVIYPEMDVPDPVAFLDCLELEVGRTRNWRPATNGADFRAVVAAYAGSEFDGAGLAVSAAVDDTFPDDPERNTVMFAVLADRWGDDAKGFTLVSASQLNAAFGLFRPLVRAAARAAGIRCRIRYPKDVPARPLSPKVAQRLDAFCGLANHSCLHPCDWGRFYRFVQFCHWHGVRLSASRLAAELAKRRVPTGLSESLAGHYEFGRSLLKGSDEWPDSGTR